MKAKLLTLAALCGLAAALAVPASGAATTVYPFHVVESSDFQLCGLNLHSDFSTSGAIVLKPSGVSMQASEFRAVVSNPATGKSIVIQGANLGTTSAPIDNVDGTVSFIQSGSGNYIVKDANGAPLSVDAGRAVFRVTVNATTGELVSVELVSITGNQSDTAADSSCDTLVPALT